MRSRRFLWLGLAATLALTTAASGCLGGPSGEPGEEDEELSELGRTTNGGEPQIIDEVTGEASPDHGAPEGISALRQQITWSKLLNPKYIKAWGPGILLIVVEEVFVWWYSSDYDWKDEILARAEMHRKCGGECQTKCQEGVVAGITLKSYTYTHRLRWRLFPSGWWYAFDCVKCDCEYECVNNQACGDVPDFCQPQACES